MPQTLPLAPTSAVSPLLAQCLARVTERLEAGEPVDLPELCSDCPECLEQLENLLPTLEAIAGLGHDIFHDRSAQQPPSTTTNGAGILGDFRILRELGRGGMGVVYEAEQLSLGRRVALKVLPFAAMLDKQQLARFKNEARAAATLDHPNIVAIYSVGTERGVHYYAMQLIEGWSLAEIIAAMKPGRPPSQQVTAPWAGPGNEPTAVDTDKAALPTVDSRGGASFSSLPPFSSREYFRCVAQLGMQAAQALDHAHQNGILHRDIKPANLLVDDAGKLWITDFGLARIEQDAGLTMTGDLLGTLRYMSPEQALAKRVIVDHRSDIYSLGVTLYELVTLQPAFTGDDRQELLRQIALDEPRKPRQINARVPQDLETIVLKAIERDPADRYATAQELADDLRRFQNEKTITAKRPLLLQRGRKWLRRNRQVSVALAALLVGALVFGGFTFWSAHQRRTQIERSVAESLAAGEAFLQSDDYDAAVERLSVAATRMETATFVQPALATAVATMLEQASVKKLARERFGQFQALREQAHQYIREPNPEYKAIPYCEKALSLYEVREHGGWQRLPHFTHLQPALQEKLPQDSAELLYLIARAYVQAPEADANVSRDSAYRRAIDALRRIEILYHAVPAAYLTIADLWQSLGEKELAHAAQQRAKSLTSSTALDYFLLGERQYDRREFEDALHSYAMALQHEPGHFLSMLACGRTLSWLHREEAAEAMFTAAIASNPQAPIPYFFRSLRRLRQGKLDLAREDALQYKRRGDEFRAASTLGLIHLQKGDTAQAIETFNAAIEHDPNRIWSRLNRARAFMLLDEWNKAIDDCSKVIDITRRDLRQTENHDTREILMATYLERASARLKLGDIEKGLADLADAATYWDAQLIDGGESVRNQLEKKIEQVGQLLETEPENNQLQRYRQSLAKLLNGQPTEADEEN
jgi:serine/threonine protein kinase/Tfp pilus assembly protein PilF